MLNKKKSFAYHIAFLQWKTRRISFRGLTHYINNKTLSTIIILFGIRVGKSITLVYPTLFLMPKGCCAYFHRLFIFPPFFLPFFRCMYICFRFLLPTFWRLSYCTFALLVNVFPSCFWKPTRKKMTLIFFVSYSYHAIHSII